jgi:CheY-like chemotaxis protein
MDGWELLSILRKEPDLDGIPVIVLSAHVHDGSPPPVLRASAFWAKPLDFTLVDSIQDYCPTHHAR